MVASGMGFRVKPAKKAEQWMGDLHDAMKNVCYKNGKEFLRLMSQMHGIMASRFGEEADGDEVLAEGVGGKE